MKMSAPLRVNGVLIKDLAKSSRTTAAMEFKPVDNELKERIMYRKNNPSLFILFYIRIDDLYVSKRKVLIFVKKEINLKLIN